MAPTDSARPATPLATGLALLALLVASASSAGAQVETTTTYTYDPVSLLPDTVTVESSDGAYRRAVTEYAARSYRPEMRAANMLSQVHKTWVYGGAAGADTLVACTQVDWYPHALASGASTYLPMYWGSGCGADLVWDTNADDAGDYDGRGRLVRFQDAAGLTTRAYYGTEGAPFSNGTQNPRVTGVRRSGFGVGGANWGDDFESMALEERYSYDGLGRVDTVYDANGRRTAFRYDGLGRLVETENDAGETVTTYEYAYSSETSATGAYDPERPNRVRTVSHGSAGQATTVWADGLGREAGTAAYYSGSSDDLALTEYDASGRPRRAWRPARVTRTSGWPTGGAYMAPDTFATVSRTYWDNQYYVPSDDAPYAYAETTYEGSPLGRPAFVRDPGVDGNGVTYRYGVGRPDERAPTSGCSAPGATAGWCARAEGAAEVMAYVETADADGRKTRAYTDGLGRTRFVRAGVGSADETLTETLYDAADRAVEVRHPNYFRPRSGEEGSRTGHRTTYRYDTRGNLLETKTPDGGVTRMKYYASGLLRYRQDADLASRSTYSSTDGYWRTYAQAFEYDALGRARNELLGQTRCSWEELGTRQCAPYSGAYAEWTWGGEWVVRANRYDAPTGPSIDGPEAWPFFVPAGSFAFENPRGRLVATSHFGGHVAAAGGRTRHTEAFSYDADGRVVRRRADTDGVASPVALFSYEYDRAGLLRAREVAVGADAFRETYTYLADGLVRFAYSGAGAAGQTVPTAADSYRLYNAAGAPYYTRYDGISSPSNYQRKYEHRVYDIEGRLTNVGYPTYTESAFWEGLAYGESGLVERARFRAPASGPYAASSSPHDAQAALREWQHAFAYDSLGRLTGATYGTWSGSGTSSYGVPEVRYDANGNVLSLTRNAPTGSAGAAAVDALSYSYTAGTNRLLGVADAVAGTTARWDAEDSDFLYRPHGLVSQHTWRPPIPEGSESRRAREYDERGLPTFETESRWDDNYIGHLDVHVYSRYDGSGRRVWREVTDIYQGASAETRYVVDGGAVVGVFDGATGALEHWNTSVGRIDASGKRYVYRTDHLGTVRAVQEAPTGAVVEARDHYPFGLEMPGRSLTGPAVPENFTGHEKDAETGLLYAGARYYMPALGRFTSVDPHTASYPGWSPYHYAANNPLSVTDPTGKDWIVMTNEDGTVRYRYLDSVNSAEDITPEMAEAGWSYSEGQDGVRVYNSENDETHFLREDGDVDTISGNYMQGYDPFTGSGRADPAGDLLLELVPQARAARIGGRTLMNLGPGGWMSPIDWARNVAGGFLKRAKRSGVGTGARSGRHGQPFNRAAREIEDYVRSRPDLLPEVREELLQRAAQYRQRARSINHPGR